MTERNPSQPEVDTPRDQEIINTYGVSTWFRDYVWESPHGGPRPYERNQQDSLQPGNFFDDGDELG